VTIINDMLSTKLSVASAKTNGSIMKAIYLRKKLLPKSPEPTLVTIAGQAKLVELLRTLNSEPPPMI